MRIRNSILFVALCAWPLADVAIAQIPKSLADAMSERGVSESSNTFGHSEERTVDGLSGRRFHIYAPEMKASLWSILRKTTYRGISSSEPKEPFIFTVLSTGNISYARRGEAFWVDSKGIAYFPIDHRGPRTHMTFKADELLNLLSEFAEKYGKVLHSETRKLESQRLED